MSDQWGARFKEEMAPALRAFSTSLPVDSRLTFQDIRGSLAHARALKDAGVLDDLSHARIVDGLKTIQQEAEQSVFPANVSGEEMPEDIHSAVESRLAQVCGDVAFRLHAGRSRNDQVVTDMLLWLRETSVDLERALTELQSCLIERAGEYQDLVIPAYTHLQRAQPVLLAHHLLAYYEMFERDIGRLRDARERADSCPLGAGPLAGSSIALDRAATAARLGFARVSMNSIDAVSARDWAIEFVSTCALVMTNLSRFSEELVLWSTQEFGIARIGDAWTTGSSAMPQKRNPDAAELVRGKAARVQGDLMTLLSLLKGLPLAYNRDLQEDKEPIFDAADTTMACVKLLNQTVAATSFGPVREAGPDFSAALDLAEELVREGVPFREAHRVVGELVVKCEVENRGLPEATDAELQHAGLGHLDRHLLTPRGSVESKATLGSTAPGEVARRLQEARARTEPVTFSLPGKQRIV